MKFVKIKGVIYNYAEYKLKAINLSKALIESVEEAITRYGFSKENDSTFYNKKYDLELKILLKNKNKMKFV